MAIWLNRAKHFCMNTKNADKLILAVPKGRILEELMPLLNACDIIPEDDFTNSKSRKLQFTTNHENLDIIRVRAFDVATFVAYGGAHIGVVGSDAIEEFNYSEIYGKSKISLKYKSKILQTFHLTNFKFKYGLIKSSIRFYRKYISTNKVDKEKLTKCYWGTIEKYLIKHHDTETEYFKDQVKEYLEKMKKKEHIEKIFFVTFPHKKNFNKTYKLNVSDVIESVVKDEKIVTHINFSKILLNDNNFNYENIYLNDGIHLNRDNHANLFMKKILDELSKYLL